MKPKALLFFICMAIAATTQSQNSASSSNGNQEIAKNDPLIYFSDKTEAASSRMRSTTVGQLQELNKETIKNGRKFRRMLVREKRWSERSKRQVVKCEKKLDQFTDEVLELSDKVYDRFPGIELCEVEEVPENIEVMGDLHNYLMELDSYYRFLQIHWEESMDPPCGERIEASNQKISDLMDRRRNIILSAQVASFGMVEQIDEQLLLYFQRLKRLYKDSLPEELNGGELFRHVTFMNDMLSVVEQEVEQRVDGDRQSTKAEQIMRYYSALVLNSNESYIMTANRARRSHQATLIALNEKDSPLDLWLAQQSKQKQALKRIEERLNLVESKQGISAVLYTQYLP